MIKLSANSINYYKGISLLVLLNAMFKCLIALDYVMPKISKLWAEIEATVRIGKKGLSENITNEIKNQLESRGVVKIKVLRNYAESTPNFNRFRFAEEIAEKTESVLLGVRGRCILLAEKRYALKLKPKSRKRRRR